MNLMLVVNLDWYCFPGCKIEPRTENQQCVVFTSIDPSEVEAKSCSAVVIQIISLTVDLSCLLPAGLRLVFLGAQVVRTSSHGDTECHITLMAPEVNIPHLEHSLTHAVDCSSHLKLIIYLFFPQCLGGH